MDRLIAEDLLLLLLDDDLGTPPIGAEVDTGLGGAVLIELALEGHVSVAARTSRWRKAKVQADPGAAESDPVLRRGLALVAEKERPAEELVGRLGRGVRTELTERLATAGILERHEGRVLGVFPRTTWPARDATHEQEVRRAVSLVLLQGAEPDPRTAALIALLHGLGQVANVVPHEGMSSRDLKKRAKEVAEGAWAAQAVQDAVAAVGAAVLATVTAASAGANA